jgi:hypothetical protein
MAPLLLIAVPAAANPEPERKQSIPANASEGPRELGALVGPVRQIVSSAPYGKSYKELIAVAPPPKDPSGLGEAKTHPALKNDPIEVQEQAQFLEETGIETRFGLVSIRGVHVFRYGKLVAIQLVLERIGRDEAKDAKFKEDVEAIAKAWADPLPALQLGPGFKIKRNDLVEQRAKNPAKFPEPPLRIEVAPEGASR